MALPMIAAVFMAAAVLMVKRLSDTEKPLTMVLYLNVFMVPISFVPSLFVWQWPDLYTWFMVLLVGGLGALAQIFMAKAYHHADASAIMPFDYARLPFVALLAYIAFGEVPDSWTWVGAALAVWQVAFRFAIAAPARSPTRPPTGVSYWAAGWGSGLGQ